MFHCVLRAARRVFYSFGTSGRSYDVYTISRRKATYFVVMYTYITTLTVHFCIASYCAKGTGAPSIPSLLFRLIILPYSTNIFIGNFCFDVKSTKHMFLFVDFYFITTICGNQAAMNTNMPSSFWLVHAAYRYSASPVK